MKITEFQEQAARTLIDAPDWEISNGEIMLLWNVFGLVGEMGELMEAVKLVANDGSQHIALVKKEGGDVLWYLAAICTKLDIDMRDLSHPYNRPRRMVSDPIPYRSQSLEVVLRMICMVEYVKKGVFHRHGVKVIDLLPFLIDAYAAVVDWLIGCGLERGDVMQANIDKLKLRYPEGWSAEASMARVDVL